MTRATLPETRRVTFRPARGLIALIAVGGLVACSSGSDTASDFVENKADFHRSPVLTESLSRFWILLGGVASGLGPDDLVAMPQVLMTERCQDAPLPEGDEHASRPLVESYEEVIEGDVATVSYDVEVFDADFDEVVRLIKVRDERWLRVEGEWQWDDC